MNIQYIAVSKETGNALICDTPNFELIGIRIYEIDLDCLPEDSDHVELIYGFED